MKNKRIIVLAILIFIIFSFFLSFVSAKVWVNSYYRKDGTYVSGYWRSDPSSTPSPISQYDYINTNKSAGTFKIVDMQENIEGYTDATLSSISENEGNIVSSKKYIFKPINIKKVGFYSVDDVMTAVDINNIGKVPNAPPFTISSSVEDVIRVMGIPESIEASFKSFKYRNSTVYFNDDWKVQSWDNRYGNLKVTLEGEKNIDILNIDEYLIGDVFKATKNEEKEKPAILTNNKTVDDTIEEYLQYLTGQQAKN